MATERRVVLGNVEAWAGIDASVAALKAGAAVVPAMVEGVSLVEAEPKVRSVGFGGWPNLLGVMECDGAVMKGDRRLVGAVAAVPETLHVARLAAEVMARLQHVILVGDGARRFADELGWARDRVLLEESGRVWWGKLEGMLSVQDRAAWPEVPLIPLVTAITDPEKERDATVFLGRDAAGG
jgi:L-asparaginase